MLETREVTLTQEVTKHVTCEFCRQEFCFDAKVRATGTSSRVAFGDIDAANQRAQARAEADMANAIKQAAPFRACPHCGKFQKDMIFQRRLNALGVLAAIAFIPAGIVTLAGGLYLAKNFPNTFDSIGGSFATFGACAVVVILLWLLIGFWFSPNNGRLFPFCWGKPKVGDIPLAQLLAPPPARVPPDQRGTELPGVTCYSLQGLLASHAAGTISPISILDCPAGSWITQQEMEQVVEAADEQWAMARNMLVAAEGGPMLEVFEILNSAGRFKLFPSVADAMQYARTLVADDLDMT